MSDDSHSANTSTANIDAVLRERFQFDRFLPGQREVIGHLLSGRSAAAVFPTGAGKSLCYQLPALMLPGLSLVVSPLIALMKDQIDALAAREIAAARLDSTLTADEYREVTSQIRSGRLRLLYVSPERFNNERFRELIQRVDISLFAVDEAHCISEWGHNFRPDYLKLARFAGLCKARCLLALTATATPKVLDDIRRFFQIDPDCAVRTGFYRSNLTLLTTPTDSERRDGLLLERLSRRPPGPSIIYVTLQRTAEQLANRLAAAGWPARPYHAGMSNEIRAEVQDWFIASDRGIVVATIAFGMGIDKSNIRYVYHYNPPKSLENYSQEIGRSGRDGQPAVCELFLSLEDLNVLENFVYGDTPTLAAVRGLVDEIFSQDEQFDVGIYQLSANHDIRLLVVRTLLTYLELLGHLEGGTPFYSAYQFKPLTSSAEILARFEGERRTFLANLLRQADKRRTWFHIDVDRAAGAIGSDRQRVVRALDYLGEQQLLEVRSAGVRHRYTRLKTPDDPGALAEKLHGRMLTRESQEIGRLRQVLDFVARDGCQVSSLCGHFGEPLDEPCGHCSWCLNERRAVGLPDRPEAVIPDTVWQAARQLRQQHPAVLSDPRSLARLLCGVTSPSLSRAKLTSTPSSGALAHVPFPVVLKRAEQDGG